MHVDPIEKKPFYHFLPTSRAFSLAIQLGLSIEDAVVRFKGMKFEPSGMTTNPDIPEADSIIDYVARFLEMNYGGIRRIDR